MDPLTLAGIGWGVTAASWLISPVLSRLVNKCFDALGVDPKFQSRKKTLDKKLEDLQTTLLPLLIILTDAAQKSPHRRALEDWLQKLKSAYYEAEHLVGLVEYKRLEKEVNSLFPLASKYNFRFNFWELKLRKNNLLKSLENIEKIVKEAEMKFATVLNLSNNTVSISNPRRSEQPIEQIRETISTPALEVIGRDKDRDEIIKLLREDIQGSSDNAKCYSVIGIWGMGGSGKTTLAQNACEYEKKAKYFDFVMWAHVSQTFSVKSIFERIWESLVNKPCPKYISIEGLQSELKEKLKGQKVLLVLDDAWCDGDVTEQQFQQLFAPLQDAQRGSKILVTTRIEGAAKALGARNLIALRQLDHNEFLELFMSHALHDLRDAEKHLEGILKQIGEHIAEKLHRSPLAATTVAARLRKRIDPDFWLSIQNENLLNETMGALLLSYQNLPPPLQRCFAFLSLFPKGYKFSQHQLVSLWIAEGFIETEGGNKHVRDIGNENMLELISSSFLEVRRDWHSTYSIHDLLHDLAEKVSHSECFRIEDGVQSEIPTQARHVYVEDCLFEKYLQKISKLKYLRTIIIWRSHAWSSSIASVKKKDLDTLFKGSRKLYVLNVDGPRHNDYRDSVLPEGLPNSVVYLENLRYLKFNHYDHGNDILKSLARLLQLRVLDVSPDIDINKNVLIPNIGRLKMLQQLDKFDVGNEIEFGLKQLEHLRDLSEGLCINCLNNVKTSEEAHLAKLSDKKDLGSLILDWGNTDYVERDIDVDILNELCPPPQLKKLGIRRYCGKRCPRWFLEYNKNTTHLKELQLHECKFLEALPETNNLVYLQSISIDGLPRLKWWTSLPLYLVSLTVVGCDSLAFLSEEDLKLTMSTRSGEQCTIDKQLKKLLKGYVYQRYLDKKKKLDSICQLKEVNGELYLPLTLEKLGMDSCFITDRILASSLQGHTSLTYLILSNIFPLTCISRAVLSSLTNLQLLKIENCLMLTSISGLETVSSLEKLEIDCCPCLTIEMPVVAKSSFLKHLTIWSCKLSDDMFKALKFLETLNIHNCPTIESPDFSSSKSLCSLYVRNCENLVSLGGLCELNNLKTFIVSGCDKLQCSSDTSKLPPVRMLTIKEISTIQFISRGCSSSLVLLQVTNSKEEYFTQEECEMLSHLSSLEEIIFEYCKMKSLPNFLSLRSLKKLEIHRCKMLTSLSELPPSVQSIRITGCSDEFTRSCEDNNHPNWQKISHIQRSIFPNGHNRMKFYKSQDRSKMADT